MSDRLPLPGPVVIGGVGGSGTRVVAQLLIEMGFYLGGDLGRAHDYLAFSLLFRRPKWFADRARKDKERVFRGLAVLTKAMRGRFFPFPGEWGFVARAVAEREYVGPFTFKWALERVRNMITSGGIDYARCVGWGWKEPNTHIYMDYLNDYYDDLRFIHVIRHGLDMAYSKNTNQLSLWGPYFGVEIPYSRRLRPKAALQFWIRANQRAVALGEQMGPRRFLLINYDRLCSMPRTSIEELVAFLGLEVSNLDIDSLSKIPQVPKSAGRHKKHDLGIFDPHESDVVRAFGFAVEA
jgi:hypothetical protein